MRTERPCACGCGQLTLTTWLRGHHNRPVGYSPICTVDGCDRPTEARGWCHGHLAAFHRTGVAPTKPLRSSSAEERFWAKVDKSGDCWIWTASTDGAGRYGAFQYEGRVQRAHRVAWQLEYGPIPEEAVIDHLCRVTLCVRVDHMDLVTQRENVLRGGAPSAANAVAEFCRHGHPLSGDNLVIEDYNGTRGRRCRQCRRDRRRERIERRGYA